MSGRNAKRRMMLCAVAAVSLPLALPLGAAFGDALISYQYTGGVQYFSEPASGTMGLSVFGAEGGSNSVFAGGNGALVSGDLAVTANDLLEIWVGGTGASGGSGVGCGGGGGTFVFDDSATALEAVAAGGGGAGANFGGDPGQSGSNGDAGGGGGGSGGVGGNGGAASAAASGYPGAAGGAGVFNFGGSSSDGTVGGGATLPGLAGGTTTNAKGTNGGFGGGGAGCYAGGGGGGYSGGGGGSCIAGFAGGGGGSFAGTGLTGAVLTSGVNPGNGSFAIDYKSNALVYNNSGISTISGNITGASASLTQMGTGTLVLTGSNNYSAGTTISAGSLQIGNGGANGSITGNVTDNANLTFDLSSITDFSGVISGSGGLTDNSSAELALSTANTYTGNTVINGTLAALVSNAIPVTTNVVLNGTLSLGTNISQTVASLTGLGSVQLTNGIGNANATLTVNQSVNTIYSGLLYDETYFGGTDDGQLIKKGVGTLTLTGNNVYGGGTTISGGSLQLGNGGTTGSITGNVTDNANLTFNLSSNITFSGVISGNGGVTQNGADVLFLPSANTYFGTTALNSGYVYAEVTNSIPFGTNLSFDGGSLVLYANVTDTVSSLSGDGNIFFVNGTTGNTSLTVNQSASTVFPGILYDDSMYGESGNGQLIKQGSGTLTLTQSSVYGGGTTISGGSLQLGDGGDTGSIAGNVTDNANLTFDRTDSFTFGGNITGTGSLTQAGTGTVVITSGNIYSGGTNVTAGELIIGTNGHLPDHAVSISGGVLQLATGTDLAQVTSLSITGGGQLDLTNNHMMIFYSGEADPIASIAAWIKSGFASGTWNGPGIISTTAQTNSGSYGIGYADSADPGNPANLPAQSIEIMYTLLGDANLDGKVNGIDFNLLATNFNQAVTDGWDEGDFNYDGKVNGIDFNLLAENFNQFASQSAVSAADWAALDSFAAANGISVANVPEPMTASMLLITGASLLTRRRRKQLAWELKVT